MNNKHEDVFIINCVATILTILGIMCGIFFQWIPAMIGFASGVGLYVMGQRIIAKREQLTKMDEQLNELRAIRELLEQDK